MSVSFEVSLSAGCSMPDAHALLWRGRVARPFGRRYGRNKPPGAKAGFESLRQDFDRHGEDVAGAALGGDVLRAHRIVLDLAPEPEDLPVDRAIEDLGAVQPRQVEQLLARQHPLWRRAASLQQVEQTVGELDAASLGRGQPAAAEVELPAGETKATPLVAALSQNLARRLVAP